MDGATGRRRIDPVTLLAAVVCGSCAALAAFVGVYLAVPRWADYMLGVAGYRPGVALLGVVFCVGVPAACAVSAGDEVAGFRRMCAGGLAVLAVVIAWTAMRTGPLAPTFDAGDYRTAVARDDWDAIGVEAGRAVRERALIGQSREAVQQRIGPPTERGRRWSAWPGVLVRFDERDVTDRAVWSPPYSD